MNQFRIQGKMLMVSVPCPISRRAIFFTPNGIIVIHIMKKDITVVPCGISVISTDNPFAHNLLRSVCICGRNPSAARPQCVWRSTLS